MIEYTELSLKIDQICKWFCCVALTTIAVMVFFPIGYTGVCYFLLDHGVESFYLFPPTEFV